MLATVAIIGLVAHPSQQARAQQDGPDTTQSGTPDTGTVRKPKIKPHLKHPQNVAAGVSADTEAPPAPIKHVCIIDRMAIDQRATVNVASNRRLAELRVAAQSNLDANRQALADRIRNVDQDLTKKPQDPSLIQKRHDLDGQTKQIAAMANLYSREIEATRQLVSHQMQSNTTPLVEGIFKVNSCSILIARDVVVLSGDAVDITQATIDAMNEKLQFKPFQLVDLTGRNN